MVSIRLKQIIDEGFQDFKKPYMFIATSTCDFKCLKEKGLDISICQNSDLAKQKNIDVSIDKIINRYIKNPITQAIVIGGLEPFLQFDEVLNFVKLFREKSDDDIVIYTGYYPEEVYMQVHKLKEFKNIIVKFGRYMPNASSIYDETLGVELASYNQFAIRIS